jgi:protein-S-isoprenylcysteine O-methyltransferase Ste14
VSLALAFAGVTVAVIGVVSYRRAKTTVNPMNFEGTSSLVTSAIYKLTRNPMYLGMLLIVVALAVFLGSVWFLLAPVAFVLYINRFQIKPEERALAQLFGAPYAEYIASVRRWL